MKTFWDVYYWIKAETQDTGIRPTYESILERFDNYNIEIIEKGISFYNDTLK